MKAPKSTILVSFGHDMDDSWYNVRCPDSELDGTYSRHTSIEKIAKRRGWGIRWRGGYAHFNPWRKQ